MSDKVKEDLQLKVYDRNHSGKTLFVKIGDRVLNYYKDIKKLSGVTKSSKVNILKCTKVRPKGLICVLERFKESCKSEQMKADIQVFQENVELLWDDGGIRTFVCHSKKDILTQFEFVVCLVQKYRYENDEACDYIFASYSFSKDIEHPNRRLWFGGSAITTALGALSFGAFAFATGGVGPVLIGAAVGSSTILGSLGVAVTVEAALDKQREGDLREILEASFYYEIISRGYAEKIDNQIYITRD